MRQRMWHALSLYPSPVSPPWDKEDIYLVQNLGGKGIELISVPSLGSIMRCTNHEWLSVALWARKDRLCSPGLRFVITMFQPVAFLKTSRIGDGLFAILGITYSNVPKDSRSTIWLSMDRFQTRSDPSEVADTSSARRKTCPIANVC